MFDTRSGFWLMASIAITAVLATGAVILWAPDDELTYSTFVSAIGFPMAVILPLIAILVGHQRVEPTQRADHVHAGPAPAPVITAKAISSVIVGVVSVLLAFAVGALGNLLDAAAHRRRPGLGREPHRVPVLPPGKRPQPADRLHARRPDPRLDRGDRRLLRLLVPAAHDLRAPGRPPELVQGPAALDRHHSSPRAACSSSSGPSPASSGPTSPSPGSSGW